MNTGQPAEVENIGVRDDGSVYVARVRAYPIFGADGLVEGFVELVEDITDRKRAEEALAKGTPQPQAHAPGQRQRTATYRLRNP